MGSPKPVRTPIPVEDEIIERIRNALGGESEALGLRDDAAVLELPAASRSMVVSVDSVVEGVHFDLTFSTVADVGWKALMSALSDVAAMGARSLGALVALCVPDLDQGDQAAVGVMEGVAEAAAATGCHILGGDVSGGPALTVVVTVLGTVDAGQAVARAGGRGDDALFVTGPCGASAAGLRLLRSGIDVGDTVERHRRPVARLAEGMVAQRAGVRAMIDVSDGLALDLHRLADASGVGFVLGDIPVAAGATIDEALGGGEDYELVMAVGQVDADALVAAFTEAGLDPPLRIGELVPSVTRREWQGRELGRLGFQHGGAPPTG